MRLYVNSHGRAGVSFGALGCLVYAFGAVVVGAAVVVAWLLRAVVLGVAWLVRELAAQVRERRGPVTLTGSDTASSAQRHYLEG